MSLGAGSPASGLPAPGLPVPGLRVTGDVFPGSHLEPVTALDRWRRWENLFLLLTAALASTITLKFASIQYLEYIYGLQILILLAHFPQLGFQMTIHKTVLRLGIGWILFGLATLVLAVAALRFEFYIPTGLPLLRYPVYIAVSRLTEIFLDVFAMLYMATLFRRSTEKVRFAMKAYFWVGVASALYSLVTWPLDVLGIASLGAYANLHRFRGFYNEGGPYGLYVISVMLSGVVLYRLGWDTMRRLRWAFLLLVIAFIMSQSKAAFLAAAALLLLNVLIGGSANQRFAILGSGGVVLVLAAQFLNLTQDLRNYQYGSQDFERYSHIQSTDNNYVLGRIAGAYIVPRMIKAHPWTGIGLGNYGTLRNAPEYRGAALYVDAADEPGLGMLGYAADLGIPLLVFTMLCLLAPFFMLRRIKAPAYLTNLALLQPLVHLFGAQFNVTYPWVVTAFALGVGFNLKTWQAPRPATLEAPALGAAEELHG